MPTAQEDVRADSVAAVTNFGLFSPQGSFSRGVNPLLPCHERRPIFGSPIPDQERGAQASNGGYDSPEGLEVLATHLCGALGPQDVCRSLEAAVGGASGQEQVRREPRMQAVIQLRSDVAALLYGGSVECTDREELRKIKQDLEEALSRWDLTLSPAHPARQDAELKRYFLLTGPAEQRAEDVLLSLRRLEAVTAAYSNPRPQPETVDAWG